MSFSRRFSALVVLLFAFFLPLSLAPASAAACDDACGPECGDCVLCGAPVVLLATVAPSPAVGSSIEFVLGDAVPSAAEPRAIEHVPLPGA